MTESLSPLPIEVLLVEDDPGDVLMTQEAFADYKIANKLNVVTNGEDAIAYMRKRGRFAGFPTPDLVLLDLNLPRRNGREVLRDIKEDPELRRRMSSWQATACSAPVARAKSSTLSNSCERRRPRVSRPAAPASRRKQEVYAVYRAGRSASARTSSRCSEVRGTSAVGMAQRSSRSMWYASSSNLGRCPVEIIVSVRTSVGGRISS